MNTRSIRTLRPHKLWSLALAATLFAPMAARSQAPALPSPQETDPVRLQLMQGFPPPPEKIVQLGSVLRYPNGRWAFHHMRELGPTAQVWRGDKPSTARQTAPRNLDAMAFKDENGQTLTLGEWQTNTYTDGLLVLHKGKVVYEKTYSGMRAHQPHSLWSMSKSFTGLLATVLIEEGKLDAKALVSQYLPELKDSAWGGATVQQTLDMTTGVDYAEDFRDPVSGIFQYLHAAGLVPAPAAYTGPRTVPAYLATVRKKGEHGAGFVYKTVDTEVIGWILQRVTGKSFAELLSERIWQPLRAQDDGHVWVDPSGFQVSSVGFAATLRDLGRVGELLRQDGRAQNRQVLPAAAIAELRKGADREKFKLSGQTMRFGYSYHNQFWVSHDSDGSFEMKGLYGQHLHINPAAQLTIVKLSTHAVPDTRFTHALDRKAFAAIAAALR